MIPSSAFPGEVISCLSDWSLSPDGALVTTHSSWALPVRRGREQAMLKVARIPDERAGYRLMSWWNGTGAAKVLAAADGALLLERALGSRSLGAMACSGQDEEACRILCGTAAQLHAQRPLAWPELHQLEAWFQPLFDLSPSHSVLEPAARQARRLLDDRRDVRPLHGDLHHDNVLDFGDRGWLAIDPHGLVGERTFDFANIFTNPDLGDPSRPVATLPGRLEARLGVVAEETDIEAARILDWIVAWTGLSAAWFIGDGDHAGAQIDLQINALALAIRG